jgi:hypothetical protein
VKRYIFLILCALMLGGVAPHRVWADRQVYDTPGDGRPSVGDDDEPAVHGPAAGQSTRPAENGESRQAISTPTPRRDTRAVHTGLQASPHHPWWAVLVAKLSMWTLAWKSR